MLHDAELGGVKAILVTLLSLHRAPYASIVAVVYVEMATKGGKTEEN